MAFGSGPLFRVRVETKKRTICTLATVISPVDYIFVYNTNGPMHPGRHYLGPTQVPEQGSANFIGLNAVNVLLQISERSLDLNYYRPILLVQVFGGFDSSDCCT